MQRQRPAKFNSGEEVYDETNRDGKGYLIKKKLWICCVALHKKTGVWWYRLKDAPPPNGRVVNVLPESEVTLCLR